MRDMDHQRHCERMAAIGLTSDGYPVCRDESEENLTTEVETEESDESMDEDGGSDAPM